MNEIIAISIMHGTKQLLTLSAIFAIGALVFVASTTSFTMFDIVEFLPMFTALYSIYPSQFMLPAITVSSFCFFTGIY